MARLTMMVVAAAVSALACGGVDDAELEGFEAEPVEEIGEPVLNGAVDVSAAIAGAWSTHQSETAVVSSGDSRYIAYNAHDPQKVTILPNDTGRVICKGATGIGYSYSGDNGATWSAGKLSMPNSWYMMWGDPAMTTAGLGDNRRVFLSSLGLTQAQVDALPPGLKTPQGCLTHGGNGGVGDFGPISASIWRATVGGNFQLVGGIAGANLDGGSGTYISETAYFGYFDSTHGTVVVAKIGIEGGPSFVAAPPFANVTGHPVLVRGWASNAVGVTVVVPSGSNLQLATYKPASNTWTGITTVATNFSDADVVVGNKSIRGRAFTAQIRGANGPVTRVVVTWQYIEGGKARLASGICDLSTPVTCERVMGWTAPGQLGFNALMPALVQRTRPMGDHADYRTYLTYWTDQGQAPGQLQMVFSHLTTEGGQGTASVGSPQTPCPDTRGYWGDYDFAYTESRGVGNWSRILRPFTDSTGAACQPKKFQASPQHVSLFAWQ